MGIHQLTTAPLALAFFLLPHLTHGEEKSAAAASRFLLKEPKSIEKCLDGLAMRERTLDPFGKHQDPNRKIIAPPVAQNPTKNDPAPKLEVLLEDQIGKLKTKISAVSNGTFMIGSSFYKRGSTLEVKVADQTFKIQVIGVTRSKITFLNTNNQKMIDLDMSGFAPGINTEPTDVKIQGPDGPIILDK